MRSRTKRLTPHRPKVVDLFCGAGGFSLGARVAGFDSALSVDIDKNLTSSFGENFPHSNLTLADITQIGASEILRLAGVDRGQIAGVIGGPPCQGFSLIGKRARSDPRNALIWHFFRIVQEIRPRFFVMENVPGLLRGNARSTLEDGIRNLSGFEIVGPVVIDAWDFGAATRRERVVLLGYDRKHVQCVTETDIKRAKARKKHSVRDAISDLPEPADCDWLPYTADSQAGTKYVDEFFSYSKRGELTDVYESTPHSNGYYHTTATYWANGVPNTLSGIPSVSSWTWGVDGEGRIATALQGTTNLVFATTYNAASSPTNITYASSTGDYDSYGYDSSTGRLNSYLFSVGATPKTVSGSLNWNPNGTLQQLAITDHWNSLDTQTCTYGYDDLARMGSVNCPSVWSQTFTFDPFGNMKKSGSVSFLPTYTGETGTGTSPTNQYYQLPGGPSGVSNYYDANGNLTNDLTHTYTWDAENRPLSIDSTTLTYDASGQLVETNKAGAYTQTLYGPLGKAALMNAQTYKNALMPLPGGGLFEFSGGNYWYHHRDWLGTGRFVSSRGNRNMQADAAYAPFGEIYASAGSSNPDFNGQRQDIVSGTYDFLYREQSSNQGRWISPDPAGLGAVNIASPQTWNPYAYVSNIPDRAVDSLGLRCTIYVLGVHDNTGLFNSVINLQNPSAAADASTYPYSGEGLIGGVINAALGWAGDTQGLTNLLSEYSGENGGVDVVAWSGGAETTSDVIASNPALANEIASTTYISPGLSPLFGSPLFQASDTQSFSGSGIIDFFATLRARMEGVQLTSTRTKGHDFKKEFNSAVVQHRLTDIKNRPLSRGPCTGGPNGSNDYMPGIWVPVDVSGWYPGREGDFFYNGIIWFYYPGGPIFAVHRK